MPFFYNLARLASYSKGYLDRNKLRLNNINESWYE